MDDFTDVRKNKYNEITMLSQYCLAQRQNASSIESGNNNMQRWLTVPRVMTTTTLQIDNLEPDKLELAPAGNLETDEVRRWQQ